MYKDILDESWYVQQIKQEGERRGLQEGMLNVIQARFPAVVSFVEQPIKDMSDLPTLRQLLVKFSLAQTAEEALQAFSNLQTAENKHQ